MEIKEKAFQGDVGKRVVLIGNVNTGKSTIFNQLCHKNVMEGNFPGTTVSVGMSHFKTDKGEMTLIDTPGSNTIYGENEDEMIAKKIILEEKAGKIVFVADAKSLKRSLAMYLHYIEFGLPVVLNINMMDEALIRGMEIDVAQLAKMLDVTVNVSVAIERGGLDALKKKVGDAGRPLFKVTYPKFIEDYLTLARQIIGNQTLSGGNQTLPGGHSALSRGILVSILTSKKIYFEAIEKKLPEPTIEQLKRLVKKTRLNMVRNIETILLDHYFNQAEKIYAQVVKANALKKLPFADKLGIMSRNPVTGIPIAILMIVVMFVVVGKFGAEFLVDVIEGQVFGQGIIPFFKSLLALQPSATLTRMIVGEYGLVSVGLALSIGVVMPVLLCFYFFFGILENSGYLPRLAILLNASFKKIGMSGKGVFPIVMGFSCVTMAILTTRVLDTDKEKNIAIFLLVQGMPCAPLLSVMFVLLSSMAFWAYLVVFGVIILKFILTGYLINKLYKGRQPEFIMEVPVLRIPKIRGLVINAVRRTYFFLKEAIPVFLTATFLVFLLAEGGGIEILEKLTAPVLSNFVGLPKESINVFLLSFIRREAGVALLTEFVHKGVFSSIQIVVNLLLISFLVPCINTILVIVKERGSKTAAIICGSVLVYAIVLGALINYLLQGIERAGFI